jgi:hypothetical protein
MAFKQRKRFRNTILATALLAFLAGGIKAGAEEIKIKKKTEPFSLETTLTYDSIGENTFNFDLSAFGEYQFDSGYKILGDLEIENGLPTRAVLAAGHPNMYLGAKWENLSGETTLLEDANLFKLETGIRDVADFLNISSFVAYTSIPNMKTRWRRINNGEEEEIYDTPLQLYTFGVDGIAKPKFKLKNSTITPWLSGKLLVNGSLAKNTEEIDPSYDVFSFEWAFNHFNVGLGADFSTKNFDFGLENYWEGSYNPFFSGTIHKARATLHDKENKNNLGYTFSINPQFNWLDWPVIFDLQSEIDLKLSLPSGIYLKSIAEINHSNFENSNLITALGYLDKNGTNIELFCNLQSKMAGITLSNRNLGNKLERYSKEPFAEIAPFPMDVYTSPNNPTKIHDDWGEDVSDAVRTIKGNSTDYNSSMQEISKYASYFRWVDHEGTFTAEQEHDLGYGVCRDTNGKLLPTVINGVLGSKRYQSWGKALMGPYVGHALTIIKKPNKKYDVMNYDDVYFLDAETEREAIDSVYPGAYAYDGGKYSETSQRVINDLEESVWR